MSKKTGKPEIPQHCSFCGKPSGQVRRLFSGHESFICDECVEICHDLTQNSPDIARQDEITELPTPAEIKNYLDNYVIGQEEAKRTVAVAVYNHYKRINSKIPQILKDGETDEVELEKANILLLGPTGTGKTLIARSLAKFLKVPFTIADATVLTEAGYVGEDVENILVRLYQASDFSVEKTQRGIIYIDEIDKISRKDGNASITRDVSGEGVQQGLLKILEGTIANIPPKGGRKHPEQSFVHIDTSNILFICGGAFDGIEKIISRRIGKNDIGFAGDKKYVDEKSDEIFKNAQPGDLMNYGLIPELVGRIPVVAALTSLDEATLLSILTEPRNALTKQYQKLFDMDGVKLRFEKDALKAAVTIAVERKTGARALRSIFEKAMLDVMYDVPSKHEIVEVIITAETINDGKAPKIITKSNAKKSA